MNYINELKRLYDSVKQCTWNDGKPCKTCIKKSNGTCIKLDLLMEIEYEIDRAKSYPSEFMAK
jgi:hypothetical protein